MGYYTPSPSWPLKTLSDTEQVIDHIRSQAKRELEEEQRTRVMEDGSRGIRIRLAELIEDAEVIEEFPINVLTVMQVAYDLM